MIFIRELEPSIIRGHKNTMEPNILYDWALETFDGEITECPKDRVYLLPCGTKTYTWVVIKGIFFTADKTEFSDTELANTIWMPGNLIHSFDENIVLPCHTLTDVVLCRIPSEEFNEKVAADAELSFALAKHYHDQFRSTLSNYRHSALDPSDVRIKAIEEQFANIDELQDAHISDAVIALFTGLHRVSVNRLRKGHKRKKSDEHPDQE